MLLYIVTCCGSSGRGGVDLGSVAGRLGGELMEVVPILRTTPDING